MLNCESVKKTLKSLKTRVYLQYSVWTSTISEQSLVYLLPQQLFSFREPGIMGNIHGWIDSQSSGQHVDRLCFFSSTLKALKEKLRT